MPLLPLWHCKASSGVNFTSTLHRWGLSDPLQGLTFRSIRGWTVSFTLRQLYLRWKHSRHRWLCGCGVYLHRASKRKDLPWWESTYHCLVTTATMSVFLEQWDIHWWDFTVDWMGHGLKKNKCPLIIPFYKCVILPVPVAARSKA